MLKFLSLSITHTWFEIIRRYLRETPATEPLNGGVVMVHCSNIERIERSWFSFSINLNPEFRGECNEREEV